MLLLTNFKLKKKSDLVLYFSIYYIYNKEAFKKDSIISIFVLQRYIYHYICVKVN